MPVPHPVRSVHREQFAQNLQKAGWVGFVTELALTIISFIIIFIAIADPNFNINLKSGLSLFTIFSGLVVLGFCVYWMFGYIKTANSLLSEEIAAHPKPDVIRKTLHQGFNLHFIGVLISLIAAQIIVANLVFKVLTIPAGGVVYQSRELLEALDIFVVQASIFMITSTFVGLSINFWLLSSLNVRSRQS